MPVRLLETNPHSLPHFPGDFASDQSDDRCDLTKLGCFQASAADLTGGVDLTSVSGPIRIEFLAIIMLDAATRSRSPKYVTGNRFACSGVDAGNLLASLFIDGFIHVSLVLLRRIDDPVRNRLLILHHVTAVLCRCIGRNVTMRIDRRDFRPTHYPS